MIDFHCHLDLYPDPSDVVAECIRRQLYVLSVTTTPSAWRGTKHLVEGGNRIRVALGLHPELAAQRKSELDLFDEFLRETRYVGEVGLDGTPNCRVFWKEQLFVFEHILSACKTAGGRILTIHSRRAVPAVLDCLEASFGFGVAVLHWYSGSARDLNRALDLGCWFSVGPAMLAGERGRALAKCIPRDRFLTETDGPFAAIEGRGLLPWDVSGAVQRLAAIWSLEEAEVDSILLQNLRRISNAV